MDERESVLVHVLLNALLGQFQEHQKKKKKFWLWLWLLQKKKKSLSFSLYIEMFFAFLLSLKFEQSQEKINRDSINKRQNLISLISRCVNNKVLQFIKWLS